MVSPSGPYPEKNRQQRNSFVSLNSEFLEELIWWETDFRLLEKLVRRVCTDKSTNNTKWLKEVLKSEEGFWKYLMK